MKRTRRSRASSGKSTRPAVESRTSGGKATPSSSPAPPSARGGAADRPARGSLTLITPLGRAWLGARVAAQHPQHEHAQVAAAGAGDVAQVAFLDEVSALIAGDRCRVAVEDIEAEAMEAHLVEAQAHDLADQRDAQAAAAHSGRDQHARDLPDVVIAVDGELGVTDERGSRALVGAEGQEPAGARGGRAAVVAQPLFVEWPVEVRAGPLEEFVAGPDCGEDEAGV